MTQKTNMWMRHALRLAKAQLGRTAPNPCVGCVIVQQDRIVGIGATANGGRPHAETLALAMAGEKARGAAAYVTLEPCCHHGQTGPCTEALIAAGIAQVVVATVDAHPQMNGKGIEALRNAGIRVDTGIEERAARTLNEGFFRVQKDQRPLVSLKIAATRNGTIARANGDSKWITGAQARSYGHALRASHDAIATGIETAMMDDPSLTCRLPGREGDSPRRFVFDRNKRLPDSAQLHPCEILTHASIPEALTYLAGECGITRLLVEAGPGLSTAFLAAGCVDWLYWLEAPILMGSHGRNAISPDLLDAPLTELPRLKPVRRFLLGEDVCTQYRVSPCLPD